MIFYSHYISSSAERVRIAFALKKLEYSYVSVRETGWDAYRDVNPQGLVPALQVGDGLITQTNAILNYLEEQFPEPALLPVDPFLRAQARAFAQQIACEMHPVDVHRIRRFLQTQLGIDEEGCRLWSAHWFAEGFDSLERTLEMRADAYAFCYGDAPGWADLHLVPHVRKAVTRFDVDVARYPLILRIYERCCVLPEFEAAAPAAQPDYPGELIDPETED